MSDLALIIDGLIYRGFTQIAVTRSIETLSGGFELTVTDRAPADIGKPIRLGQRARIAIDGEIVIDGFVDRIGPSHDANSHTISIAGRDAAGDLVDSAAVHKTGEWTDQPVVTIVRDICAPFAIAVAIDIDAAKPLAKFRIEEGETAYEAIARACRLRAVLPVSDAKGGLLLTRASTVATSTRLVRGDNILAASAEYSQRDRYSTYVVKAQQGGISLLAPRDASTVLGQATDSGVTRYRPHIMIAEGPMDPAEASTRAAFEARTRAGRARRLSITVQGWRERPDGPLWRPNRIVNVSDNWLGIDAEDLLIAGVSYRFGSGGETAVLTCMPPDAFDLIEAKPKTESSWLN